MKDADRIGFADQFIYEYLSALNTKQSVLKLEPFLREEALSTFDIWGQKEDKIPY